MKEIVAVPVVDEVHTHHQEIATHRVTLEEQGYRVPASVMAHERITLEQQGVHVQAPSRITLADQGYRFDSGQRRITLEEQGYHTHSRSDRYVVGNAAESIVVAPRSTAMVTSDDPLALDAADGVIDGKYYGAPIVRRAATAAEVLDAADGVMDGRYYGSRIVGGDTEIVTRQTGHSPIVVRNAVRATDYAEGASIASTRHVSRGSPVRRGSPLRHM